MRFHIVGIGLISLTTLTTLTACGQADPQPGTWSETRTVVSNTCNSADDTDAADNESQFTLNNGGDGTFTIQDTVDDGTNDNPVVTCTIHGKDFTCTQVVIPFPLDDTATMNMTLDVTGSIPSQTEMDGTITSHVDCTGSTCSDYASFANFPCDSEETFRALADL
jgi:hypothetical protein